MIENVINEITCPACGHKMDRGTPVPGQSLKVPEPNTLSICIRCTTVSMFDDNMQLRTLTAEESEQVNNDPRLKLVRQTIVKLKKNMQKGNA